MNNFSGSLAKRQTQGGVSMPLILGVIAILVLVAVGAWFLILRPHNAATSVPALPTSATATTSTVAAPPPVDVTGMSTAQLLDEARNAVRAQRWVAPAGNNAFEFYLQVLAKDPNNQVAQDALRESFTTGANTAEQAINASNFDEAQREIDLLAKADSGNYTLTILRSKLDAQRKLSARAEEQQKQQDALAERQAANAAAAAAAAAAAPEPEPVVAPEPVAPKVVRAAPVQQPVAPPPEPKYVGPTRDAQMTSSVAAVPPRMAVRRHRSGYVVVEFTVTAAGTVTNLHVLDSQPSHIFDRSALDAVRKYKFKPALKNGVPVSSVAQQRINFSL